MMAGFVIEASHDPPSGDQKPLQLVSLGKGELLHTYSAGPIRALWSRWPESRQLFVRDEKEHLFWVEGQPDRLPAKGESLRTWLQGRWGSFRGFEIDGPTKSLTVFGDPLGTRPIFYLRTPETFYISDKLATLATMAWGETEVNWGALLEVLTLGALYSKDTTLAGAEELPPGVALCIKEGRVSTFLRSEMPEHLTIDQQEVIDDPSGSLFKALKCAVEEVWVDPEAPILLSGGLDSRLTLWLAGPGRKALTVTTGENRESRIARRIAQTCGADFRHIARPPEQYHRVIRDADLLGAAMYYPPHAHHLHMASEWREQGVHGLAHGYGFETFLKGWLLFPVPQKVVTPSFIDSLGAHASLLLHFMALDAGISDVNRIYRLFSEEGQSILRARIANLAENFHSRPVDGLETAFEQTMVSRLPISRSSAYPNLLSWMEEQDVYSPVFHQAIWSWHTASQPRERYKAKAFIDVLKKSGHDISTIPNSNTGLRPSRKISWLTLPKYQLDPIGRKAMKILARLGPKDKGSWPPLDPVFRLPAGKKLLEEGLAELKRCSLFNHSGLQALVLDYLNGNNRVTRTVLGFVGAARWIARVREGAAARRRSAL